MRPTYTNSKQLTGGDPNQKEYDSNNQKSTMPKIVISAFCQDRDQKFCDVPLVDMLASIKTALPKAKNGYRNGVIIVPIPTEHFSGRIVTLQEGDILTGSFTRRQPGETPRKEVRMAVTATQGHKLYKETQDKQVKEFTTDPLVAVDAVLYHKDVLAEGNENSDPSADYEVIAFLTKISLEEQPMPPETLMANHFLSDGGTATNMSPEKFEEALRKSYNFWKGKALIP